MGLALNRGHLSKMAVFFRLPFKPSQKKGSLKTCTRTQIQEKPGLGLGVHGVLHSVPIGLDQYAVRPPKLKRATQN